MKTSILIIVLFLFCTASNNPQTGNKTLTEAVQVPAMGIPDTSVYEIEFDYRLECQALRMDSLKQASRKIYKDAVKLHQEKRAKEAFDFYKNSIANKPE